MKKITGLLSTKEVTRLWILLVLIAVKAVLRVLGIATILPFMALVTDPEVAHTNKWLNFFYEGGGFTSERSFLLAVGGVLLLYMALSNSFVALVGWIQAKYTASVAHRISTRMIRSYVSESYEFFLTRNTIDMLKRAVQEADLFVKTVLSPLLEFISRSLIAVVILLMLLLVDPKLALISFGVVGGAYGVIFFAKRTLLAQLGQSRVDANKVRFRALAELMTGIKEIQLYQSRPYFYQRYFNSSEEIASIMPRAHLLSIVPRYLVETIAYGGILLITLYMIGFGGELEKSIPILSLYAFAGYRLLPALQAAFQSIATVKHGWPIVEEIQKDVSQTPVDASLVRGRRVDPMPFSARISLKDIDFTYAGEERPALRRISLDIDKGSSVAFVGRTGSGKTTLVDVMTGLLLPTAGQLQVDETPITARNRAEWQARIGYVTQELFLLDDTVAHNIAFGLSDDEIDHDRVIEAAKSAQAHDFILELLPKGYDTVIGQAGVRLSGGQRVRLGLARALYRRPSLIILDEATSALDGITERAIIDELVHAERNYTLILIAHRMSTVKTCDSIFLLEDGELIDTGTYHDLLESSVVFSEMKELTS